MKTEKIMANNMKTESSFFNEKLNQMRRQIDPLPNENRNDYGGKYKDAKFICSHNNYRFIIDLLSRLVPFHIQ